MYKNITLCALFALSIATGSAQSYNTISTWQNNRQTTSSSLKNLDLGVTVGTTGIGLDVSAPLSPSIRLRTGFEIMPHIEKTMHFEIMSFDQYGNITDSQFDRMSETLEMFTGYKADSQVDMVGKPTFWNFKLLVDFYPFSNKHWHLTAGFHWGPSKVAEAINSIDDSPSLFAVNMYNHLYYIADQDKNHDNMIPLFTFANGQEIYLEPTVINALLSTGQMGLQLGYYNHDITDSEGNIVHKAGEPYRMVPNSESQVTATAHANAFKPYLGFGYEGRLFKKDNRYKVGFDCGMMFWGGTPSIITHDGTDIAKDVDDIQDLPGKYISIIKGFKVFPVLNLRITKTFSLK